MSFDNVKIALLKKKIEKEIEQIRNSSDGNYYFLTDPNYVKELLSFNKLKTIQYFYGLYSELDKSLDMPMELGDLLKGYFDNDCDKRLGIHRTGAGIFDLNNDNCLDNEILNNIFSFGIINQGDAPRGVVSESIVPPSKTVSIVNDMLHAVMRIKTTYKGNVGILLEFPKEIIDKEGHIISGYENDIYDFSKHINPVIRPEFLVGFVINDNGKCYYHPKSEIIKEKGNSKK